MKTIFKKSLVALALTGAALSAQAVTVTGTTTYANEGITTLTGTSTRLTLGAAGTSDVVITLGADVPQNGLIRVNFSVPVAALTAFSTDLSSAAIATTNDPDGAGPLPAATLQVANYGTDFVVYRVTNADGAKSGSTITFDNSLKFISTAVVAAKGVSFTVATETATGSTIEAAKTEQLVKLKQQVEFSVESSGLLSKTIDVATKRTQFTGSAPANTEASLVITETNNSGDTVDSSEVAYKSQKFTLEGDFSWIKDTNTTTTGIQAADGVIDLTGASGCTLNSLTATVLKVNCDGTVGNKTIKFDLAANAASKPDADVYPVLNATSFSLTGVVDFSNPGGLASNELTPFNAEAVGSWKLNGADVTIPYMVYGTVGGKAYNQVIQLTNKSTIEGAIYVDIFDGEGKQIAKNSKLTVTAKANSVTNLATEIKALVAAAKYEGKVSVRVIAEVPSATAQVYAAYQDVATSERAIVVGLKN